MRLLDFLRINFVVLGYGAMDAVEDWVRLARQIGNSERPPFPFDSRFRYVNDLAHAFLLWNPNLLNATIEFSLDSAAARTFQRSQVSISIPQDLPEPYASSYCPPIQRSKQYDHRCLVSLTSEEVHHLHKYLPSIVNKSAAALQ